MTAKAIIETYASSSYVHVENSKIIKLSMTRKKVTASQVNPLTLRRPIMGFLGESVNLH